jgi:hypothetical protein
MRQADSFFILQLKEKLEVKIGFEILYFHDCRIFSDILKQEKISISAHTLARFFGVLKENHRPYVSTLNLLSRFLCFESFAFFCNSISTKNLNLLSGPTCFSTGAFSYTALELAINSNDWKSIQLILESYDYRNSIEKNEVVAFLGNAVRHHEKKQDFLNALSQIEHGQALFFESFVDEDDPGGYYSNALTDYYLKNRKDDQSVLFKTCFQISKKLYYNKEFSRAEMDLILSFSSQTKKLHFHQISRIFEIRILISGNMNRPFSETMDVIEELLNILPNYSVDEQSWYLSRAIKALAYSKRLEMALKKLEFKEAIIQHFHRKEGKVSLVADLIIQLTYHLISEKSDQKFTLRKLNGKPINETNARIAIESATASLFAEKPIKSIIEKNLLPFSQATGNSWVMNLIQIRNTF